MNTTEVKVTALLRDNVVLAVAGLAIAILMATAWLLFHDNKPTGTDDAPARFTHMHCSACNDEIPYHPQMINKKCEACTEEGTYVPTAGSIREGNQGEGLATRVTILLIVSAAALQGLAYTAVL